MTEPKFKVVARPGMNPSPEYIAEVQAAFDREKIGHYALQRDRMSLGIAFRWASTKEGWDFWRDANKLCILEVAEHTCECRWWPVLYRAVNALAESKLIEEERE